MSDIQRYNSYENEPGTYPAFDGQYIYHTDHIAAVEAVKATVTSYDEIIEAAASAGDAAVYEAMRSTTFDPSIPDNVAQYVGNAIRAAIVPSPALEANQQEAETLRAELLLFVDAAYDLSTWTACINWRGRKDNQTEWLDELREKIELVQSMTPKARATLVPSPALEAVKATMAEQEVMWSHRLNDCARDMSKAASDEIEIVKAENRQLRKELMISDEGNGAARLRYYYEQATIRAEAARAALETMRSALERIAIHTSHRPCDCERCYCGKPEDAAEVAAWDEQNAFANIARAALQSESPE